MSLSAAAIRLLVKKGLSAEDIAEIAEANSSAPKRSAAAERTARWRARKSAQTVTGDVTRDAHNTVTGDVTVRHSVTPPRARVSDNPLTTRTLDSSSEANASDGDAVTPDLNKQAWDTAVKLLTGQGGMRPDQARTYFGKVLSETRLAAREMLPTLTGALVNETQDPKAYVRRAAERLAERQRPKVERRVGFV